MTLKRFYRTGTYLLYFLFAALAPAYASGDPRTTGVLFSGGGLLLGIWCFYQGFGDFRLKRRMAYIPVSTLRAMAPGQVEVNGSTVNWKALTAPLTQTICVYYEYKVEQKVGSGKNSHWETITSGSTDMVPFYLDDQTAVVRVHPFGAKIILNDAYHLQTGAFSDVPVHINDFLYAQGISSETLFGFEKTMRFTERHFRAEEIIFVLGTCQDAEPHPDPPPAPNIISNICLGQRKGDFFILSNKSREDLEESFQWKSFGGIFGGIALIGICLYVLVEIFTNNLIP